MSIENEMASLFDAKLAPLRAEVRQLKSTIERLLRALPPQLATPEEAGRALGISTTTVRRRLKDGSLPAVRIGRLVRVDLAALHGPTEAEVESLALGVRHAGVTRKAG